MKKILWAGLATGLMVAGALGTASATLLTTEINMDNGYEIFISTSDSVQGTSFGSLNNWYATSNKSTTLSAGTDYYLHVYGYDQGVIAGFLGEFSLSGTDHIFSNSTTSLLTNLTDWKGNNTGWGNAYLSSLTDLGENGASPWGLGYTSAIPTAAHWVWAGGAVPGIGDYKQYAYFSTKISATSPIPEPATMLLFGTGIAGLASLARRRKNN